MVIFAWSRIVPDNQSQKISNTILNRDYSSRKETGDFFGVLREVSQKSNIGDEQNELKKITKCF